MADHDFENPEVFLFARAYHAALNYGDSAGGALPRCQPASCRRDGSPRAACRPQARRLVAARLATLDVAGAAAIAGTHDTGRLRFNGRRELQAIEASGGGRHERRRTSRARRRCSTRSAAPR